MVLGNELKDYGASARWKPWRFERRRTVSLQNLALAICDSIDPAGLDLVAGAEEALPARHRIRTDKRTVCLISGGNRLVYGRGEPTALP